MNCGYKKQKSLLKNKQAEPEHGQRIREAILLQRMADLMEEVQSAAERELVVRSREMGSHVLRQVCAALKRIDDGSYGVCVKCQKPSSLRRLKTAPWAALCLRCQTEADRTGARLQFSGRTATPASRPS
jgi:DnaK suppressor protein